MKGFSFAILVSVLVIPGSAWADGFDEVLLTQHNLYPAGTDALIRDVCQVCHVEPIRDISPRVANALPMGMSDQGPGEGDLSLSAESAPTTDFMPVAIPLWDAENTGHFFLPLPDIPPGIRDNKKDRRPFGPSFNCLTCHDGALGSDVHQPSVRVDLTKSEDLQENRDRSPDHPDSIQYPRRPSGDFATSSPIPSLFRYWSIPDRNENGVVIPDGPMSAALNIESIDLDDPLQASVLIRTFLGTIHCDSCHNPHLNLHRPFLRVSAKDLCLSCHQR